MASVFNTNTSQIKHHGLSGDEYVYVKYNEVWTNTNNNESFIIDRSHSKTMSELNDMFNNDKYSNMKVESFDLKADSIVFKPLLNSSLVNNSEKALEIKTDLCEIIICTPEQKMYVHGKGYMEAKNLSVGDKLVSTTNGFHDAVRKITEIDKEIQVYNIIVEDTHNVFANNVLVQDCVEIDLQSNVGVNEN